MHATGLEAAMGSPGRSFTGATSGWLARAAHLETCSHVVYNPPASRVAFNPAAYMAR